MKLLPIITSSIYQIIALIFFIAFLLGVLNIHFSDKKNYCEMTYMYEYPQFVKITLDENKEFPQYGLYAYSEGRYTERARKMWFDGIPVLYLPGNSGSHMQARSLASVALRMALSRGYEFHFDYFTISYNEELSGLYGGVLQRQTKFAAACISKILSLYKPNKYTKSVPTSVIVIGHSMGGLIAKRLLAYPSTISTTNISIALAAPLAAPAINFDWDMDSFYSAMETEWERINSDMNMKETKMLISFGSGARDLLIPAGLTASNDSDVNALTTSIPGVWVSTEHVTIVWCRQLVITINKFLFSIVDPVTEQLVPDKNVQMARARQYFVANRSMFLNPDVVQPNATMLADAFWYEDNRRIYQISRPEIDKMTYLMIRLVSFPQNRFVAIESVNLDDKDWIFGCNAQYAYNSYRYCKQGSSLSELSRWTGADTNFGKRKLATIHLHDLIEKHPDWSHVVVKVSPTRRPVTLNVDINDHASRQLTVDVPSHFSFTRTVIKQETEAHSLYYELILPGFNAIWQAYLLYVEPVGCKTEYHVSAEMQVPWAENQEYYHYFTHLKKSPMKLRLYKTHPNVTRGQDTTDHVKVVLLLDPQCKYSISIASSWYHVLAQSVRAFAPVLITYVGGAVLLIAKSVLMSLHGVGTCLSIHGALRSDDLKPYAPLVFVRVLITLLMAFPISSYLLDNASAHNYEMHYFTRSIMVLAAYFVALGLLNVAAAGVLFMMVFSSQLAHRMLFRILWRGGQGLAERVAVGLQKVPMVVSAALITLAPLSCGAAALVAGGAFYAFMISKMYEEYLEDYFYKLAAKYASRFCRAFRKNKKKDKTESDNSLVPKTEAESVIVKPDDSVNTNLVQRKTNINEKDKIEADKIVVSDDKEENGKTEENKEVALITNTEVDNKESSDKNDKEKNECDNDVEDDGELLLSDINFHMMMFFLWAVVTLVNVPALLTWARNFKYSMVLKPDNSRFPGLILSICSTCIWQMDGPRKNLKNYNFVAGVIFVVAVIVLTLGPLSLTYVNFGVTFAFALITAQQLFDTEEIDEDSQASQDPSPDPEVSDQTSNEDSDQEKSETKEEVSEGEEKNECDPCNENRIYNVFKNLRDKFSFSEE
ncbi:GPI inositol-deacylase [Cydia fagiglandana]|uniref:GPI inositol-deacylase n=1 Tax=Cydia fagiglandana TaxID=1458189 RepID=UPI002FEDEDB0